MSSLVECAVWVCALRLVGVDVSSPCRRWSGHRDSDFGECGEHLRGGALKKRLIPCKERNGSIVARIVRGGRTACVARARHALGLPLHRVALLSFIHVNRAVPACLRLRRPASYDTRLSTQCKTHHKAGQYSVELYLPAGGANTQYIRNSICCAWTSWPLRARQTHQDLPPWPSAGRPHQLRTLCPCQRPGPLPTDRAIH